MKKCNEHIPLFSIITVCLNAEKTIKRTIESVLKQTYQDFEYIIVDGASNDSTVSIIESFSTTFKDKLKFISEKDKGIYDAINKGIKLSTGNIIGIVNSDDWYEYNTLEIIAGNYISNQDRLFYGLLRYFREGKEYQILSYNHEFLNEKMINHPTCFISRGIYNKIGFYNTEYKLAADYDFILRCKSEDVSFFHIPLIVSNMSMEGKSKEFHNKSRLETFKILYKHKQITYLHRTLRIADLYMKYIIKKLFHIK